VNTIFKITLLILFSYSFTFSTGGGPDYWRVQGIASDYTLWMHAAPDYHSKKIGKIQHNAKCLKYLKCTEEIVFTEYRKLSLREQDQFKYQSR